MSEKQQIGEEPKVRGSNLNKLIGIGAITISGFLWGAASYQICSAVQEAANDVLVKRNEKGQKLEIKDLGDGQYIATYYLVPKDQYDFTQPHTLISIAKAKFEKAMPAIKVKAAYLLELIAGTMSTPPIVSIRIVAETKFPKEANNVDINVANVRLKSGLNSLKGTVGINKTGTCEPQLQTSSYEPPSEDDSEIEDVPIIIHCDENHLPSVPVLVFDPSEGRGWWTASPCKENNTFADGTIFPFTKTGTDLDIKYHPSQKFLFYPYTKQTKDATFASTVCR